MFAEEGPNGAQDEAEESPREEEAKSGGQQTQNQQSEFPLEGPELKPAT